MPNRSKWLLYAVLVKVMDIQLKLKGNVAGTLITLKDIPDNITILGNRYAIFNSTTPHPYIVIPALGGNVKCYHMDWVCKGVKDELYPCKPDIFDLTYESVVS